MKCTYEAQIPQQKKALKSKQELHMMFAKAVESAMDKYKKKGKELDKLKELNKFKKLSLSLDSNSSNDDE